jgi:hypothetical protein
MAIALFNPVDQKFTRVPFKPAWTNTINIFNILDKSNNQLVLFEGKNTDNKANFTFSVYRLDLTSGQWTTLSDPITITDYYLGGSAVIRLADGRLFVTGGTTSIDYQFNFSAVNKTFMLKLPEPPQIEVLFDNGNIAGVSSGPTKETTFTLSRTAFITLVRNYHYFNQGALPGTIALRHSDGSIYGPWQTYGQVGQGNVPNAYWAAEPMIEIKAGSYTVIDSDPATWSHNSGSGFAGFTLVNGYYTGNQNPYLVWAQSRKLTEKNWDRSADPDEDGLMNEIEYALLTDPLVKNQKSSAIWPVVFRANGCLAINYRQRSGGAGKPGIDYQADGIQYIWEISSDLKSGNWKSVSDAFEYIGNSRIDNGDGTENIAVRYKDAFESSSKLFFRLRIIDASIP